MDVKTLLRQAVSAGATDVIFSVGAAPFMRLAGKLQPLGPDVLTAELAQKIVLGILSEAQREKFMAENTFNMTLAVKDLGRFRVTAYRQRGMVGAVFRVIAQSILPLDDLGVPQTISRLLNARSGLLIFTGPSGNGVTTTMASVVNHINQQRNCHIITLEQPIEFTHTHSASVVDQIEIGRDANSFAEALENVPYQNPEVVVISELSDLKTIASAIKLASTGRLVIAGMKTASAAHTLDNLIQIFPEYQQQQIRTAIATCLLGICSQRLVPCSDGQKQTAAFEMLVVHEGVRDLIMQDKLFMLEGAIKSGAKQGMVTLESSLKSLLDRGLITGETYSIFTGKSLETAPQIDPKIQTLEKQLYDRDVNVRKMAESQLKKMRESGNEDAARILDEFGRYYITNFEENKISTIKN